MVRKLLSISLVLISWNGMAQLGLLQRTGLSDANRRLSLTGSFPAPNSFCIRPVNFEDSTGPKNYIHFSEVNLTIQDNSKLAYGDNDESLYPAAGFQQRISLGLKARFWKFSIDLQPEWVTAANTKPDGLAQGFDPPNYWGHYYEYVINKIDQPSRFGPDKINKWFPGQSAIRFNPGKLSFGLSTENIWWGPGLRNALTMTNNAPGFLHFTFNTSRPLKTRIGSFEGQYIAGQLDSSGITPYENTIKGSSSGYFPKINDTRFITGLVITWQPRWIPNLYVGFTRISYLYGHDMSGLKDVLPLPFFNNNTPKKARLGSMFFRYAMPEDHAEFYFEYGRADRPANPVNIFQDIIPTGYVGGLRKLFALNRGNQFIEFSAEVAHLQLPDAELFIDNNFSRTTSKTNSWYTHAYIRQGYTNDGQVLGAAIGPGSNSQTLNLGWVNQLKKIGIQLERIIHNNDFYYFHYYYKPPNVGPNFKYYIDLSVTLQGQWDYNNFLFAGAVKYVSALNYGWEKLDGGFGGRSALSDKKNVQLTLSVLYKIPRLSFKHSNFSHQRKEHPSHPKHPSTSGRGIGQFFRGLKF
ncbi:MAG: hypothetical protein JWN76_1957 [Chitinophagaceae bacterium]|nr:hypothetical protein [Chitinophagaceae bacterium]